MHATQHINIAVIVTTAIHLPCALPLHGRALPTNNSR
jgi:hypothetical protein